VFTRNGRSVKASAVAYKVIIVSTDTNGRISFTLEAKEDKDAYDSEFKEDSG